MFTIICPTVRPREVVARALARIWETCTWPTELVVVDGAAGKSATLNDMVPRCCVGRDSGYLVTVDDDVILPPGWQDDCVEALQHGSFGAVGLDLSGTPHGAAVMVEVNPAEAHGEVLVRPAPRVNLVGSFLCMRVSIARLVPPYPWDGQTHYEFDEDHFRCKYVKAAGYNLGYVVCRRGQPELLEYEDSPEYRAMKERDINYIRTVRGIAK